MSYQHQQNNENFLGKVENAGHTCTIMKKREGERREREKREGERERERDREREGEETNTERLINKPVYVQTNMPTEKPDTLMKS